MIRCHLTSLPSMGKISKEEIIKILTTREPLPLERPMANWQPKLTADIADLNLHPAVEAGLHLLNSDMLSAHFLVRKAQGKREADYWHGILHRIEGDYRNSRAWYENMDIELVGKFHGSVKQAHKFCDDCRNVTAERNSEHHDVASLKKAGMAEMLGLLDVCIRDFGLEAQADVSEYYGNREDLKKLGSEMTLGYTKRAGKENDR